MSEPVLLLVLAVVFEVFWAVMLKVSRGFTVLWASLVTIEAYGLSLVFLTLATRHIKNISMVYAIWTGSGAAAVAVIGVLAFKEPLGFGRAVGLLLVVTGVVVLVGLEGTPA